MDVWSPELLLLLAGVGLTAGFLDSIAGGGGLLTLPVLLATGLPPLQALATNKLQGSFGTLTATVHFAHKGAGRQNFYRLQAGWSFLLNLKFAFKQEVKRGIALVIFLE